MLNGLQPKQISAGSGNLGEADQRRGVRADRALRLRVRPRQRQAPGRGRDEGEHHEVHGRPLPLGLPRRRRRLPGHRGARGPRRRADDAARAASRGVRRPRPAEPLRRHRERPHRRSRRRPRSRAGRQHRRARSGLRGDPRLGTEVQGPGPGEPDRHDPLREAHARAPRRARTPRVAWRTPSRPSSPRARA